MKKLFFLSFISFIVGCGVSSKPVARETVVETQPVVVETVVEQPIVVVEQPIIKESPDLENSVYKAGYERGYKSFMKQMGIESADDSKEISYTSNVENESQTEEQTQEDRDIMMKGYVDGYHKAGESSECKYCPRN
jgi:hypothetical protein